MTESVDLPEQCIDQAIVKIALPNFPRQNENSECKLLIKQVCEEGFGNYIWPSSLVLADYIAQNHSDFLKGTFLELGAGTCLPSLLLAALSSNSTVFASDCKKFPQVLENMKQLVATNKASKNVKIIPLTWGDYDETLANLPPIDVIFGADVFYDSKEFENIISTVHYLLTKNPQGKFITAYHHRCPNYNLTGVLRKWGLTAALLNTSPSSLDINIKIVPVIGTVPPQLGAEQDARFFHGLTSVHLFAIRLAAAGSDGAPQPPAQFVSDRIKKQYPLPECLPQSLL
eukprot:GCRY01001363.1.p1 GENE.GCRY01001363.1~~GCRY01001363.1.p1  ORF type:complete len:286 (-),score=41.70 GCRY01001363.1:106-963(-)